MNAKNIFCNWCGNPMRWAGIEFEVDYWVCASCEDKLDKEVAERGFIMRIKPSEDHVVPILYKRHQS